MEISECAKRVHDIAVEKGWWQDGVETRNFGELMMLIVTEAAECYEHYRDGQDINEVFYFTPSVGPFPTGAPDKPDGIPIELADIMIRVMDVAVAHGINLEEAIRIKMAYNETRPHRHGGKKA